MKRSAHGRLPPNLSREFYQVAYRRSGERTQLDPVDRSKPVDAFVLLQSRDGVGRLGGIAIPY